MYMSTVLNQVHVLLPGPDLKQLKKLAKNQKKSIGELIRQAIRKTYGTIEPTERKEAFQRLSLRSELQMDSWDKVKADLLGRYE